MTSFRIREPVDVLLDYRDAAELEIFRDAKNNERRQTIDQTSRSPTLNP